MESFSCAVYTISNSIISLFIDDVSIRLFFCLSREYQQLSSAISFFFFENVLSYFGERTAVHIVEGNENIAEIVSIVRTNNISAAICDLNGVM